MQCDWVWCVPWGGMSVRWFMDCIFVEDSPPELIEGSMNIFSVFWWNIGQQKCPGHRGGRGAVSVIYEEGWCGFSVVCGKECGVCGKRCGGCG